MPMYKQWVLSKDAPILNSKPKTSQKLCEKDFELVEEQLRELCKGEILCRALFLSIDPITRLYISYGLGKSISKFFWYWPIRKFYTLAFIGIVRYEKRLIGRPLTKLLINKQI